MFDLNDEDELQDNNAMLISQLAPNQWYNDIPRYRFDVIQRKYGDQKNKPKPSPTKGDKQLQSDIDAYSNGNRGGADRGDSVKQEEADGAGQASQGASGDESV